MVSWLVRDPKTGVRWLIQRGDKADPVIAVDKEGRVLRSFGKGLYRFRMRSGSTQRVAEHPRELLFCEVGVDQGEWNAVKRQVPSCTPWVCPLVEGRLPVFELNSSSRASVGVSALRIMSLFIGRCSKSSEAAPAGILWQACQLADNDPYSRTARSHFSDCRL